MNTENLAFWFLTPEKLASLKEWAGNHDLPIPEGADTVLIDLTPQTGQSVPPETVKTGETQTQSVVFARREGFWQLQKQMTPGSVLHKLVIAAMRALPPFSDRHRHYCRHLRTWQDTWPDGGSIEICVDCGMSRTHWEQGQSSWLFVDPYNDIESARRQIETALQTSHLRI